MMKGWICQLGDGYMLYGKGNSTYKVVKTGYPYPDLEHTNVDGLCSVFGEEYRDKIQDNARGYMDIILSNGRLGSMLKRSELVQKPSGVDSPDVVSVFREVDEYVLLFVPEYNASFCNKFNPMICGYTSGNAFLLTSKDNDNLIGVDCVKCNSSASIPDVVFNLCRWTDYDAFLFGSDIFDESKVCESISFILYDRYMMEGHSYLTALVGGALTSFPSMGEVAKMCGMSTKEFQKGVSVYGMTDDYKAGIDKCAKTSLCHAYMSFFTKATLKECDDVGNARIEVAEGYSCLLNVERPEEENYWLLTHCLSGVKDSAFCFNLMRMCGRADLVEVVRDYHNRVYVSDSFSSVQSKEMIFEEGEKAFYSYLTDDYDKVMAKCMMLDLEGMTRYRKISDSKTIYSFGVSPLCNWLHLWCSENGGHSVGFVTGRKAFYVKFTPFSGIPSTLIKYIDLERLLAENESGLIGCALRYFLWVVTSKVGRREFNAWVDLDTCFKRLGVKDMSLDLWSVNYNINGSKTVVSVYYGEV